MMATGFILICVEMKLLESLIFTKCILRINACNNNTYNIQTVSPSGTLKNSPRCYTPEISALRKKRQMNCELEASQVYIVSATLFNTT